MPIRVVLPDGQEIVGRLHARRQLSEGWVCLASIPVYQNTADGHVEPVEYRMWLRPQDHLMPVEGVSYASVPTERIEPPSLVEQIRGPRRPSGWVLENLSGRTGRSQAVVHAADCGEAPTNAPRLSLDQSLDAADGPGSGCARSVARPRNSTPPYGHSTPSPEATNGRGSRGRPRRRERSG
ncbi:DUF6233 domain-containing protein [Streptomyces sp. CB02009]|uniref:DUF6233 domain-containing protein n=1 Tax=Streptomyces sp. CB02009 TaxID=1703938 RepID=UPI000A4DC75F